MYKHVHVLVVDDNSPDKTAQRVEALKDEFPGSLHLLSRPYKSGLGRAYIDGFKWALQHPYSYIFEMDSDFSHNPKDLEILHKACISHDVDEK